MINTVLLENYGDIHEHENGNNFVSGSFGLYLAEQVGEEYVGSILMFSSKWFQVRLELEIGLY